MAFELYWGIHTGRNTYRINDAVGSLITAEREASEAKAAYDAIETQTSKNRATLAELLQEELELNGELLKGPNELREAEINDLLNANDLQRIALEDQVNQSPTDLAAAEREMNLANI